MPKRTKSSSTKVMLVKSTVSETFTIYICIYLNIKFRRVGQLVVSSSQFCQDTGLPFFPAVTSYIIIIVRFSVKIRCLLKGIFWTVVETLRTGCSLF